MGPSEIIQATDPSNGVEPGLFKWVAHGRLHVADWDHCMLDSVGKIEPFLEVSTQGGNT